MKNSLKHIIVLGAGFGGMTFCKQFSDRRARITLIDRQNYHLFQPLLYQVATAALAPSEIAQPIRTLLQEKQNLSVYLEEVTHIDLTEKIVYFHHYTESYDYLVLALGGATSYFNKPEWEEFAPGLKSLEDATRIRRDILLAIERAENSRDPEETERLMTIVVVGAGPTGVELAGAFAELTRTVMKNDFKNIDPSKTHIIMLEAGERVLPAFPPHLSESAKNQLTALGVNVRTSTKVKSIEKGRVELESGEFIQAENIIWTAGVAATPLTRSLGVEIDRANRVIVNPDLSIPGHPEAFVIGDMALIKTADGRPVPGVSPAAIQMGRHAARVIEKEMGSGVPVPREPFQYFDKGSMATIGRGAAVAKMGRLEFTGFPAWLAWLVVHLMFLVGFRNKVAVVIQWTYHFFAYKRGARIIMAAQKDDAKFRTP